MDGHSLGKAMAGVAYLAVLGAAGAVVAYAFLPAFVFLGAIQLATRLAVGAWYPLPGFWQVYAGLTGLWLVGNATLFCLARLHESHRRRRREAEHQDFMRLRKLFYRDNEVCLDSYETLKRRAGEV